MTGAKENLSSHDSLDAIVAAQGFIALSSWLKLKDIA